MSRRVRPGCPALAPSLVANPERALIHSLVRIVFSRGNYVVSVVTFPTTCIQVSRGIVERLRITSAYVQTNTDDAVTP